MAKHHACIAIETGHAPHNAQVIGKVSVAMHFDEVGEDIVDVIERVRTLGMARDFSDLPRR